MVCNGWMLLYLYILVFGSNWGSIGYLQIHASDFLIFEFYWRPPNPIKCIFEAGGSKSRSGDQGIPHWKCNIQYLIVYEKSVKEAAKDKVYLGWRLTSKWGSMVHHQDGSKYVKDYVDERCTEISQGHIFHWFWPMEMDYTLWIYSQIPDMQYVL